MMDDRFITYSLEKRKKEWHLLATYNDEEGTIVSASLPLFTYYTMDYMFSHIIPETLCKIKHALNRKLIPEEHREADSDYIRFGFRKSF